MYFSNKIIDKCLKTTYDWGWFNNAYAKLIKLFYIPLLKSITYKLTDLRLHTRHSIHSNYFKAFGSDVDITLVGDLKNLKRWKKLYNLLKRLNRRLGEWEFYTDYEFRILTSLKNHNYNLFWCYLNSLRKLAWVDDGFKPGQEFKKHKTKQRILNECSNLNSNHIKILLTQLVKRNEQQVQTQENFSMESTFLRMKLGNTKDSILLFEDFGLYKDFIYLLPSDLAPSIKMKELIELKCYILMREILLNLAGGRYSNTSNRDWIIFKECVTDFRVYLKENCSAEFLGINMNEFNEKIKI